MPPAIYQPFPMLPGRRAQIWRYSPEYRRPRHFHPEPELNLVVSGSARFGTGSVTIPAAPGDLLWWPPGCEHELLDASPDFDLYVFALTPELCARVLTPARASVLTGPLMVRLDEGQRAALHARLAAPVLTAEASVAERHVAEVWLAALDSRRHAQRPDNLGRRVLRSLLQSPELGRSERARLVRAHPSELSRSFHRELGLTLGTYRTRLRLLRFIELVDAGQHSLLAAALEAGFGSYSQAHRAFRTTLGCMPRTFFGSDLRRDMADTFEPFAAE
ncbi:MAG TPA: helix-turn-helix transcriptional regulator [Polyangiaceae bacterium]|nr:helix-turn-helix transcriptional regulator [Polyangiaceae bacterium]